MSKGNVTPFPFETLPHFQSAEVALIKKLQNTYQFLTESPDFAEVASTLLSEILKTKAKVRLADLSPTTLEKALQSGLEDFFSGVFRIEPLGRKAVVAVDGLLAKILVQQVLAGDVSSEKIFALELKPVTVLEEAAVQYVLISALEKWNSLLKPQKFSMSFESVQRDIKPSVAGNAGQESYAAFSLRVVAFEREFYVKVFLPLSGFDPLGLSSHDDEQFYLERMRQFGSFPLELQVEAGEVTLLPSDIENLSEGDIVLLDNSQVEVKKDRTLSGVAKMRVVDSLGEGVYEVNLESTTEGYKAIVSGYVAY